MERTFAIRHPELGDNAQMMMTFVRKVNELEFLKMRSRERQHIISENSNPIMLIM
ncbi:MAG: hypothetical protein R3A12_03220 [Ignavibacteria bacterium]